MNQTGTRANKLRISNLSHSPETSDTVTEGSGCRRIYTGLGKAQGERMAKPKQPGKNRDSKTPKVLKPKAPSHRSAERTAMPDRAGSSPTKENSVQKEGPRTSTHGEVGARVTRRAADRLRSGHLWVYASDIEHLVVGEGNAPSLLPVADSRGLLLGTALYSPTSQIALRLVSRDAIEEQEWMRLLESRLRAAISRRKPLLNDETNACRLCFSEADELPGLVADKYGDLIILQLLTKGLDSNTVREACVRALREELNPAAIMERPDPRVRELEGLAAPGSDALWQTKGFSLEGGTEFRLNGLQFHFDPNAGQKTGAFLDQRANYAAARDWAERLGSTGRALDVCCYQGGFALHLAQVCRQVTGIDASHASLEVAERNLETNRNRVKADVDWMAGDAFQILRDWSDAGEQFDTIVLDPPAFAKTQRAVEGALRGYKELNLRALRMVNKGGLLVTCSCSHHVGWKDLVGAVAAAAADAHRRVRIMERRGASLDHPVVLNLPETEYLKCLILQVE
jgi:23S rRNA (cytosine1962-C5)-methyltransferase